MTKESKKNFLLGFFVALVILMNLLGVKITTILGVSVSVAIFMVPLTFLITDAIEEVFGKKEAERFVFIGAGILIITFLYTLMCVHLPANARYAETNPAYVTIFSSSLRIMVASLVAFLISQYHDVWAFNFWKKVTHGKALWVRNNFSTWVSQAIDTFLFMMIAFYHVSPKFDFWFIIQLAIPYYLFKLAFAVMDTPFVYLIVYWLKRGKNKLALFLFTQRNK